VCMHAYMCIYIDMGRFTFGHSICIRPGIGISGNIELVCGNIGLF